ncbi:hypothetical protein ACHAPC_010161 [Botrytis cinerea]|uniref:Restriction of telomere capping protein 4 n=2 Tax=Botryotinia fuckeliana TaxID=40559 RepID=G2YMK7_BOTF4|nr:hypothetical protein BcDW1_9410 [Botrytis cinerea BcDW1]CCD52855.1 hypothetical protein BofuT4_P137790.1 [Botrytis cinerea T4]
MDHAKLDLNDRRKTQPRRAGLTKDYPHNLLQSLHRPKREAQPAMPTEAATKTRPSNVNSVRDSGNVGGAPNSTSCKRKNRRSNKENEPGSSESSVMKSIEAGNGDVDRPPDDSDEDGKYLIDSSEDESPSRISADMTKTVFGSKGQKPIRTSTTSSLPVPQNSRQRPSETKSTHGNKRKNESDSEHAPDVNIFGNMQSSNKKLKSYTKEHPDQTRTSKPGVKKLVLVKDTKPKNKPNKPYMYGKKKNAAPVNQFINYKSRSPSLVSDNEKQKLQDYTTDSPTKNKSPARGFVRPDFSDDDFSDLDLFSKLKSSKSAPPSTQSRPFQRYDDDDILDGAEELAKKLNPDTIIGMENLEREDSSDADDYTGSRCPMCNEPVAAEDLKALGKMNTRKQEKFCLSHQRKTARSNWKSKGYPDIDWETLDSRISNHHTFIKKIIGGATCHYREVFDEKVKAGKDRNLMKSSTNLIPGYYGSRGLRLISENIMDEFTPLLKYRAPLDRLIAARSAAAFVDSVVVPEVTVLLIKEDMSVSDEEARTILTESSEMGDLVNEEIKDVVTLKPEDKKSIGNSYDEDDDNAFNF